MDQPLQDLRHGQPAHAALKGRGRVDPHLLRMRTRKRTAVPFSASGEHTPSGYRTSQSRR
jgi:hypothetical protein